VYLTDGQIHPDGAAPRGKLRFAESQMVGMAYPAISKGKLQQGLFPLPPVDEQKRIIAKIDEPIEWARSLVTELRAADSRSGGAGAIGAAGSKG